MHPLRALWRRDRAGRIAWRASTPHGGGAGEGAGEGASAVEGLLGALEAVATSISQLEVVVAVARLFSVLSMAGGERKRRLMVQRGMVSTALLLVTRPRGRTARRGGGRNSGDGGSSSSSSSEEQLLLLQQLADRERVREALRRSSLGRSE